MSIRFPEDQVRPTGRDTMGVKAITLDEADDVIGFAVTQDGREQVLTLCAKGYGKRTSLDEFRVQNRGGKGVILIDASDRNGPVVGLSLVKEGDEIMVVTDRGRSLRTVVRQIRETGRNAQGVRVMSVDDGEQLIGFELLEDAEEAEETEETEGTDVEGESTHDLLDSQENQNQAVVPSENVPPSTDLN